VTTQTSASIYPSGKKRKRLFNQLAATLLLTAGGIFIMFPFFWMVSTSLKKQWDVYYFPPIWIPNPPQWINYVQAISIYPFGQYVLNTLRIVVLTCINTGLSCSLAAYGFSRLRAPGRDLLFVILLSTMMLPYTVTMIPLFQVFNTLKWVDTIYPLVIPSLFGNIFYIFLLRQFFLTIPRELEDSARIDGCNSMMIFWRIILPLALPAFATVIIFQFMESWNDFIGPLIYLSDESHRTVALALAYFQGSAKIGPQMHLMMAVAFIALIPPLLLFFFAQKLFIQGIVFTGVKG
jgi:ABC-type glycerol-3-phosphate transport system permease component